MLGSARPPGAEPRFRSTCEHVTWTLDGVSATSTRATPGKKEMGAMDILRDKKEGLKKEGKGAC